MPKRVKSKLFRRMVLSYFAILAIPIVIFCSLFYSQIQRENREWEQKVYQESVSNIVSVADRKFFDITSLGDRLLASNWLQRVRSDSDIITRYFDATRMNDISQELLVHAASLGVADDLAVLLPAKNQAISPAGWGDMDEMLRIVGIREASGQEALRDIIRKTGRFQVVNAGEAGVIAGSDDLLVFQSLDVLSESRAILLVRIGKGTLDSYLEKFRFSDLVGFSMTGENGAELYRYQAQPTGGEGYSGDIPSTLFSWSYKISLKEAQPAGQFEQFSAALLALLLTLSMGLLAAYLLAAVSYRPIRNLVSRIGGDKRESEFQTIGSAFDRLTAEKEKLNAMVQQYQNSARNNLLFNLLHGCFADEKIQAQMNDFQIGYENSQYFTVLVFHCPEARGNKRFTLFLNIKAGLMAEQLPFDLMETLDEDIVAILNFSDPKGLQAAEKLVGKLPRYIREKMDVPLHISCGTEEKGIIGISKSYQAAKERSDSLRFSGNSGAHPLPASRCYYPTDWELQLINNLKLGNTGPALKILQELRRENDRRKLSPAQQMKVVSMIFDTILRLMDELEMDSSGPAAVFEESFGQANGEKQWEYLAELARQICGRASYSSEGRSGSAGEQILRYVDANFENPDLSLQVLGDQLGLSVSAISRIFKATVKINFYDYLCRIRMEKAKEYLRTMDAPIAEVARRVGYENELSFKRAFVRYEGIKPREYRQNPQEAVKS